MAAPEYVVRSYGGGAQSAQLVQSMGPLDTSFGINTTVGWTETTGTNVGSPLGTSGPFLVVVDRFTNTVEKILCSAINTVTGVVTVYTSTGFTGRGYDGTTPQGHVPNGSTAGVQTGWPSEEAFEANQAVSYVMGTAGGTRTPGNAMVLGGSGLPTWSGVAGLQSVSLYGVDTAPVGSAPARLTGAFLIQAGTPSLTFTSGFAELFFPQTFPNGFLGITYSVLSNSGTIQTSWYSASTAHVEIVLEIGGSVYSGSASISYLALGF